jgi:hypothetical protein
MKDKTPYWSRPEWAQGTTAVRGHGAPGTYFQ